MDTADSPPEPLARDAAAIAAWLGEDETRIAETMEWHGTATVAHLLEYLKDAAPEQRGPLFFRRLNEIQDWRKRFGYWPTTTYRRWRSRG